MYGNTVTVQTPIGPIACRTVQITWDTNNDGIIDTDWNETQYVSSQKSLVKTLFVAQGTIIVDSLGNPIDTTTWTENCTLSYLNF